MTNLDSIFGVLKDSDKYVYHYTKCKTAIEHLLEDGIFQFSPLLSTNDPKETKDWQLHLCTRSNRVDYPDLRNLSDQFTASLKQRISLACFCCDGPLSGEPLKDISFRGWAKARMWSQYGVDIDGGARVRPHEGVCLVYEREEFHRAVLAAVTADSAALFGRISYRDRPFGNRITSGYGVDLESFEKLGLVRCFERHVLQHAPELLFEKRMDWASESEYRWVFISEPSENFVRVPSLGALRAVIVGADCAPDVILRMVISATKKGIPVTSLDWINGVPWRDFRFEERARMIVL